MSTTSLKLPDDLKARAAAAAKRQGMSPHAFMVDAIRATVSAAEARAGFVEDALSARERARRSGKGYRADEVHEYLSRRAGGETATRPRARAWRR